MESWSSLDLFADEVLPALAPIVGGEQSSMSVSAGYTNEECMDAGQHLPGWLAGRVALITGD
jgi:hypothetical protein